MIDDDPFFKKVIRVRRLTLVRFYKNYQHRVVTCSILIYSLLEKMY